MAKQAKKAKKPKTNGRNGKGQFAKGHKISECKHKHGTTEKTKALKAALVAAVTPQDIIAIAKGLVKKAKTGDVHAAREIFDRCIGKVEETITGDITVVIRKH